MTIDDGSGTVDRELLREATARPGTDKAAVIQRLAGWADDVKPWLVLTPVLLVVRRRPVSVLRAWAALALAAAGGALASSVIDRPRPSGAVLDRAKAGDQPSSSSMPSKHTASAAAFVSALATRDPVAGALLVPVAGFVAWSRVASARHYPSDVIAGAAAGVAGAAAVELVPRGIRRLVRSQR